MATHTFLFTGHMIDAPGRQQPRFPPEKEAAARKAIQAVLLQKKQSLTVPLQGIAGAACGGDILFQETCRALGIPSEILLALPPEVFRNTSVAFAGPNWSDRYDALLQQVPVHILPEAAQKGKNIWEAANADMLQRAMQQGGENMTLIALWDGQSGDGPGGTQHLADAVQANGGEVVIITPQAL